MKEFFAEITPWASAFLIALACGVALALGIPYAQQITPQMLGIWGGVFIFAALGGYFNFEIPSCALVLAGCVMAYTAKKATHLFIDVSMLSWLAGRCTGELLEILAYYAAQGGRLRQEKGGARH